MISYMSKALRHEKHQGPLVNHESFRFACNLNENEDRIIEKYLAEVEYSVDTSYQSQLRRKIAGQLEPRLAYRILKAGNFDLKTEDSFIIQLPDKLSLTDKQQEILEKAVCSVYGNCHITYEKVMSDRFFQATTELRVKRKERDGVGERKTKKADKIANSRPHYLYQSVSSDFEKEQSDQNSEWYKIRKALKEEFGDSVDKTWFSQVIAEEREQQYMPKGVKEIGGLNMQVDSPDFRSFFDIGLRKVH